MEVPAYTIAALCAIGGVMGYTRKHSLPSLLAGSVFALLYATAGYMIASNGQYGLQLALGTSSTLMLAGIIRANQADFQKPIPNLLLALGAVSTAYYSYMFN